MCDGDKALALLIDAVNQVYEKDQDLIKRKGVERTIVSKTGVYFEYLIKNSPLKDLDLDIEYTQDGEDPKQDKKGPLIRPDLILHDRGKDQGNILAAEFKQQAASYKDVQKLKTLTDLGGDYRYKIGVAVKTGPHRPVFRIFRNGEEER